MRRITILKSAYTVIHALESSGLPSALQTAMESFRASGTSERGQFDTKLLASLVNFAAEYRQFTDAAREITSIIGIERLTIPENWQQLVQPESPAEVYSSRQTVDFAIEILPMFLHMITPSSTKFDSERGELEQSMPENRGIVSVLLYDNGDAPFTVDRFILLFTSMSALYDVSSQILGKEKEPLILLGCDSGDVKGFDFEGAGEVIENVKEIINSVWDRIVLHRENKVSRRLDLVTQSLPILKDIEKLKKNGTLGPEAAALLKQNVLSSVKKFIESGATTPEMEDISSIHPHLLMTPEPKQLAQGEGAANEHD